MAGSRKTSASPSKKPADQRQFSISAFLPKLAQPKEQDRPHKKAKLTHPANQESSPIKQSASSSSLSPEKPQSRPNSDKGKQPEVIDLTADDEDNPTQSQQLWADLYAPQSRDELGVHPKKVDDVQNWLNDAFNPKLSKYRRLLVLSGPAGAAKTATIKVLANEMDFDILEYQSPSNHSFANDDSRESLVNHLTAFLSRAGMAPALELVPSDSPPPRPSTSTSHPSLFLKPAKPTRKRLILIEDLPNVSNFQTRAALRSALLQYLVSPRVTCPLVLIVSDALSTRGRGTEADSSAFDGGFGSSDNIDARTVCGPELLNGRGCHHISFNPVAVTIMKKALVPILDKVYSDSPADRPTDQVVDMVVANSSGDFRSALMSLQFIATHVDRLRKLNLTDSAASSSTGKKTKGRKKEATKGISQDAIKEVLSFVSSRESTLLLFHALGKVLYSKRWGENEKDDKKDVGRAGILQRPEFEDAQDAKLRKLPKHLKDFERDDSKVDPESMFAEVPVDSDMFLSYLEHNFVQFTNDVSECSDILERVSASDSLMRLEYERGLGGSMRVPLTSQYSFQLAVRGTLFHLPRPVPRRKQTLRKSKLWDSIKLANENEQFVRDVVLRPASSSAVNSSSTGSILADSTKNFGFASADVAEAVKRGEIGIVSQRGRTSLWTEFVPFAPLVCRRDAVVSDTEEKLIRFPDLATLLGRGTLAGEALDEKEAVIAEEEGDALQQEQHDDEMAISSGIKDEELLFDPDDDIAAPD